MSRKATTATARTAGEWQGMNWIRQDKRLAIYLRDGLACAYCGHSLEAGAALTLDHIRPHSKGGSNHECNLVTACTRCNYSRGNRPVRVFAIAVAEYINDGTSPAEIIARIERQSARKLATYRAEAKALIESRKAPALSPA